MTTESTKLLFAELETHFDVSFWYELERLKLGEWRLDTPEVQLHASVASPEAVVAANAGHKAHLAALGAESFDATARPTAGSGKDAVTFDLVNHNTPEDLKGIDRHAVLAASAAPVLKAIASGDFSATPAARGVVRTFADLKTHVFSSATAVPVIDMPAKSVLSVAGVTPGVDAALYKAAADAVAAARAACVPVLLDATTGAAKPFTKANTDAIGAGMPILAMSDYSSDPKYPAWPWRNVVCALRAWRPGTNQFRLLCLRGSAEASVTFDATCDSNEAAGVFDAIAKAASGDEAALAKDALRLVGWAAKIKRVDLGAMMDPTRLAESSAKLNLGLMKWRMMPGIDLTKVASLKCLLLGSGTLGCNIARHLMMWGVNHITLVDRGMVSYSNPVRQTLFELSDCTAEGPDRIKSIAAARAIKRILPTCNANGVELTIRMPGHAVDKAAEADAVRDIESLDRLIQSHDVVFLLTDSRESRWLPTLICAAHDKPVINSALGFDTYLVMRHGLRSAPKESRVGCYFCNDVVAPMDSLTARTLDQQCTVTRPGVSAMASALSVELLAALCNHEKFFECPAYVESEAASDAATTVIGIVPHQVRGSVSDYSQMTLHGVAYDKCTACSDKVVELYQQRGAAFVIECLNNPKHVETITGLAAEREALAAKYADWDDDDFSSSADDDA
eukprot:CAMPEP_0174829126 /NCGR_PEP_ID=MMETSP1114-20130205/1743_1 /TAXON_ID=312471 /ORGANISM="Neobodo designis, Strain CCAP 1951/1" /LENGTH=677 /DNA_ID=CAMNT_0016062869 /DNA_START=83 /DNA_END=2116 /DNA_ORIENTATION=-